MLVKTNGEDCSTFQAEKGVRQRCVMSLVTLSVLCEKPFIGYFRHMTRRNKENLKKDILFSEVPGSRVKGRSANEISDCGTEESAGL